MPFCEKVQGGNDICKHLLKGEVGKLDISLQLKHIPKIKSLQFTRS